MEKIIIHKKISKKIVFYILAILVALPTLYFYLLYMRNYNNYIEEIGVSLENSEIDTVQHIITNHFEKFNDSKKALLLYLKYLEKKEKIEPDIKNWQEIIKTVSFLQNHYYFIPESAFLLKAKAFFVLGPDYYPSSLAVLKKIYLFKKKSHFKLTEIEMAYTICKNLALYQEANELIDYLIKHSFEKLHFQIEKISLYIEQKKNNEARELLKNLVFLETYNNDIKHASQILIEMSKQFGIAKEVNYLYNYIIHKSGFDQNIIKSYILFLKDQNQINEAIQYIADNYKLGHIDKTTKNWIEKNIL